MKKKKKVLKKNLINYSNTRKTGGVIFVKSSPNSFITENSQTLKAVEEREIDTYQIIENKKANRFEIFRLDRRRKPRRIKTIRKNKGVSINTIRKDVEQDKIKFKIKTSNRTKYKQGTLEIIQSNYYTNLKIKGHREIKLKPQLIAVVKVIDTNRKIEDFFVGFSKKMSQVKPSEFVKRKADDEAISMAIAKFISIYGLAKNSGDLVAYIIKRRFQYYKFRGK